MENIHKLEIVVASWYKNAPHLPEGAREWIANNLWWLTLIGVVLGAVGAFSVLMALFAGAAIIGLGGSLDATIGGAILWSILATLLFAVANVVIAAVAITPLKSMRKLGWSLLFLTSLINVASLVISVLFNYNFLSFIYGLVFAAVGVYFLFEIRSFYHEAKPVKKAKAGKPQKA